jgi:hypothetical protein
MPRSVVHSFVEERPNPPSIEGLNLTARRRIDDDIDIPSVVTESPDRPNGSTMIGHLR